MKVEKEFHWMLALLESRHVKRLLRSEPACKKDFERLLGAPENDRDFTAWFYQLVAAGALEAAGEVKRGSRSGVQGFLVNRTVLERLLSENPVFPVAVRYFNKDRII